MSGRHAWGGPQPGRSPLTAAPLRLCSSLPRSLAPYLRLSRYFEARAWIVIHFALVASRSDPPGVMQTQQPVVCGPGVSKA